MTHRSGRALRAAVAAPALLTIAVGCSPTAAQDASSGSNEPSELERQRDIELVPAVRRDVVETSKVEATVGFGTVVTLPLEVEGIVTWTPEPRSVLSSGDVLIEVGGRPVVLVAGETPLYRPLRLVPAGERDEAGTRIGVLSGADVGQLQRFLLAKGFDDNARLEVDEAFGLSTHRAVKAWQTAVGHPATGVVDAGQMVFMPGDLLVANELVVGQRFTQLDVTGTNTVLQVTGSTTLREFFAVGSTVEVLSEPPVDGVVTRSTRISSPDSGQVGQLIEVAVDGVAPDELGQSVLIVGSVTRATDALAIPVRALLALSDGGWQVEIDSGSGTETVPVVLEQVVDTTAIVSGIDDGAQVVVPL